MGRALKLLSAPLFIFIFLFVFSAFNKVEAALVISEFSSASSTEWVELLNTDQDNSVSLTNYTIKNGSNVILKTLSGTVPRGGFLTFELSAGSLTDAGDCMILRDGSDSAVYSIAYGTGSCGGGNTLSGTPTSIQTGALINSSWAVDSTPSRGWCNDATGGCPTIATIVSSMNAFGVSTNLGDQTDFSRTSGLYFQKSETTDPNGTPMGKITFLAEINFTDRDALSWMSQLDTKIDMSTRSRISMDATLIQNLVTTQAQLTMYGLTLGNPKIQVDGADDTGGVVSSMTYSGGTLTFTAAHFTIFTAVENSSSGSSTNTTSTPACSDFAPTNNPHLFQINTTPTSAKLYFTPVNNYLTYYYIAYGFTPGDERFGVSFPFSLYSGVIDYTVNHLQPNTTYYFKVRGGAGCAPGGWSNNLTVKTEPFFTNTLIKVSESPNKPKIKPSTSIKPKKLSQDQKSKQSSFLSRLLANILR